MCMQCMNNIGDTNVIYCEWSDGWKGRQNGREIQLAKKIRFFCMLFYNSSILQQKLGMKSQKDFKLKPYKSQGVDVIALKLLAFFHMKYIAQFFCDWKYESQMDNISALLDYIGFCFKVVQLYININNTQMTRNLIKYRGNGETLE